MTDTLQGRTAVDRAALPGGAAEAGAGSAMILDGLTAQSQATRAEMGGHVTVLADRTTKLKGPSRA